MKIMKQFLIILLSFLFFSSVLFAQKADDILGQWYSENNESLIEIYKSGNKFFGKIIWLKEPLRDGKPKVDDKNPDSKFKDKPLIGLVILKDFVFDGKDEWNDGKIYDPKSGKTYSCYMEFESKDKLKIRGYIGISLIVRTTFWSRKKD